MSGFLQIERVSYFNFHSSLGFEIEDITMEGLCRGEIRDSQGKDSEGCSVLSNRMGLYQVGKLVSGCSGGVNWLELSCEGSRKGGPGKGYMGSKISPPKKGISLKEGSSKGDCKVWVLIMEYDVLPHLEQPGVWCLASGIA